MKREWGVRDRRTGGVVQAVDFQAAQECVNRDSVRCELMVRVPGSSEWVAVEWLTGAGWPSPLPPSVSRCVAFYEVGGRRHTTRWVRALYVGMGRVIGHVLGRDTGLFRRSRG